MAPPEILDTVVYEANSTRKESRSLCNQKEIENVTESDFFVDASAANRDDQLVQVVKLLCPFLDQIEGIYDVKPLAGGLSNELFVVSRGSQGVLVRIHPTGESIVNHHEEFRILAWLSQQGDAPGLYGQFSNGRVEEFLHGYVPLSYMDMAAYAPRVATHMAHLHQKVVPAGLLAPTSIWTRIDTWFDMALARSDDPAELSIMLNQWKWLKDQLSTATSDDPVVFFCRQAVFCHMDLQSLNILHHNDDLRVIDYEYAGMYPRAVDISNTWLEYCDMNNIKADYEKEYPTVEQQNEFLRVYLSYTQPTWGQETLHALRTEIGKHTLVSHLGWAVWGYVQSHLSNVGFDYVDYAQQRMKGYYLFRDKFFGTEGFQ
jgi:thiamine kinase-like enzyme